jgi:hypothetical protein
MADLRRVHRGRAGRFVKLAFRVFSYRPDCYLINVTRLWNWADCQVDPEGYFMVLAHVHSLAFRDSRDLNSLRFAYHQEMNEVKS